MSLIKSFLSEHAVQPEHFAGLPDFKGVSSLNKPQAAYPNAKATIPAVSISCKFIILKY
jgi:hypothetical protein